MWFCGLEIIKRFDLRGVCIGGGFDTGIDCYSALLVRHMKFNTEQLKCGLGTKQVSRPVIPRALNWSTDGLKYQHETDFSNY